MKNLEHQQLLVIFDIQELLHNMGNQSILFISIIFCL